MKTITSIRIILRLGGLLTALVLTAALGLSASRAAAQPSPQLGGGFPVLSLSYSDAQGPGAAFLTPQGPLLSVAG